MKLVTVLSFFVVSICLQGADPVPLISSVTPASVSPGGGNFTLTVRGTGFRNGDSKIFWNGAALPNATFCTPASAPAAANCQITVPGAKIASAGSANITVVNGTPGKTSNGLPVEIHVASPFNAVPDPFDPNHPTNAEFRTAVAIGDFNRDGKPDVAALGVGGPPNYQPLVQIFLGNGDGTFTPVYPVSVGTNPTAIAVGDFNQDGNLDLAVTNHDSSFVSILLGDGTGGLTAAASPPVGLNARSVVTGDFKGDGNLDLAVGNVGSPDGGGVQILIGDGRGGFTPGALYPNGGGRLAIGDFNSDGKLDFAGTTTDTVYDRVNLFLGDGAGGFVQNGSPLSSGPDPVAILATDFNGDGKLDLAVLSHCGGSPNCYSGFVSVSLGDGLGNFKFVANTPTGYHSTAFAAGDLDGDGSPDLVVVNNEPPYPFSTLTVLLNDGIGHFNVAYSLPTDGQPTFNSAAMADFNGDGKQDFVGGFVYLQSPPGLVNSVSPSSGSGRSQTFTAVYSDGFTINNNHDLFAAENLTRVTFQMNTSSVAAGGCYVVFDPYEAYPVAANSLYLYDDTHKNLLGPITPGQPGTLSNSQCTLDGAASSVSVLYNNLTLKLALSFSPTFVGQQNIYLRSFDADGRSTAWQQEGTWLP